MVGNIRRYLVAGLLFWLPIWVTLLLLKFVFGLLDGALKLLPSQYQPEHLFGLTIPGFGLLLGFLLLLLTGMLVSNFLGKRLVLLWDKIIARIPLIRSIYSAVKQVSQTMLSSDGNAFRQVLLVEYPRKDSWSIAFLTGEGHINAKKHLDEDLLTVFIPTTPNPTSGFLIMVPREDVIELEMSVDAALKFVISLGVVQSDDSKTVTTLPTEVTKS